MVLAAILRQELVCGQTRFTVAQPDTVRKEPTLSSSPIPGCVVVGHVDFGHAPMALVRQTSCWW